MTCEFLNCGKPAVKGDQAMFQKIALTLAAGLFAIQLTTPAVAQTVCAPRATFVDQLGNKYQENPVAVGLTATGSMIEVLAAQDGSWTILITKPGGPTCMVSHGEAWQTVAKVALGPSA
jgi:hypothetical protein